MGCVYHILHEMIIEIVIESVIKIFPDLVRRKEQQNQGVKRSVYTCTVQNLFIFEKYKTFSVLIYSYINTSGIGKREIVCFHKISSALEAHVT